MRELEEIWVDENGPKGVARYNHLPHTGLGAPRISGGIGTWLGKGEKGLTDMQGGRSQ